MKQIIVMIAMILLGISIAGYVSSFNASAGAISDNAIDRIEAITSGALKSE